MVKEQDRELDRLNWNPKMKGRYTNRITENLQIYKCEKPYLNNEERYNNLNQLIIAAMGKKTKKVERREKWYTTACDRQRITTMKALRRHKKHPNTGNRLAYLNEKNLYETTKTTEKINHIREMAEKLAQCTDSGEIWKLIKVLNGKGREIGRWIELEEIVKKYEKDMWDEYVDSTETQEWSTVAIEELDKQISEEEVMAAIISLKEKKAAGIDGKCGKRLCI